MPPGTWVAQRGGVSVTHSVAGVLGALMELTTQVIPGLTLRDPFMVGASHWTESEAKFRQLAPSKPSALTLKTVSPPRGGNGASALTQRERVRLEDAHGNFFGMYVDGPQTRELILPAVAHGLTRMAKELLPDTALGLSVLQGEEKDYKEVAAVLDLSLYSYVELNFKYSFRSVSLPDLPSFLGMIGENLHQFIQIFRSLPVLVKLSREATALLRLADLRGLLRRISDSGAGIIIANSMKLRVPPSRTPSTRLSELSRGVVVGEYLLFDTYNSIAMLTHPSTAEDRLPPIVASGGVVDIGGVVDVLAAGACAVQLCTALDTLGVHVLPLFRQQLQRLGADAKSFPEFVDNLRADPAIWRDAATGARGFRVDEEKAVDAVLADDTAIGGFISEAVVQECKEAPIPAGVSESCEVPEGIRFVLSMGNAASFLAASRVIEDCRCTEEVPTVVEG